MTVGGEAIRASTFSASSHGPKFWRKYHSQSYPTSPSSSPVPVAVANVDAGVHQ